MSADGCSGPALASEKGDQTQGAPREHSAQNCQQHGYFNPWAAIPWRQSDRGCWLLRHGEGRQALQPGYIAGLDQEQSEKAEKKAEVFGALEKAIEDVPSLFQNSPKLK